MSIGRICLEDVELADADDRIVEAARRMAERGVGTLLVVDERRQPIGIVSDRDLVVRVLAAGRDPGCTRVGDVMTRNPTTAPEDTAIEMALGLMRAGGFRRLPVVDQAGKLLGIVTLDDVLALLAEEFAEIGEILTQGTPHPMERGGSDPRR